MARTTVPLTSILIVLILFLLVSCSSDREEHTHVFVTEYGTGPDKWVTAWLLSRYLYPDSVIKLVEAEQEILEGVSFDIPSAEIHRSASQSSFEKALDVHAVEDQTMRRLATAIHDIEVNYWAAPTSPDAIYIDQAFRMLHRQLIDHPQHIDCYLLFFESVYRSLEISDRSDQPLSPEDLAIDCSPELTRMANQGQVVEELPIDHVLTAISSGQRVTFIDVREPQEYLEAHIPGAKNLTLREVNQSTVESFKHDDLVVSYCVKDFRGFEMAKLLQQHGVKNAVILNPFGIQGWVAEGLPVVGKNALPVEQGEDWLQQCNERFENCASWVSPNEEDSDNAQG